LRSTIALYFIDKWGCPKESKWKELVPKLMKLLLIPTGSRNTIMKVFRDCLLYEGIYDPDLHLSERRKGKFIVKDKTDESALIYRALQQSISINQITAMLNARRQAARTHENVISINNDGEVTSPTDGGQFPERYPVTTVKYPLEARFIFGAAINGTIIGI
jgi:hypothetical protein